MRFIIFAFLMFLPTLAQANIDPALQGKRAENYVQTLADDAISTLERTKGNPTAMKAEFKNILNSRFDMNTISRFALGRYWTIATPEEKTRYQSLFKKMIVDVYTNRFAEYTDQKIEIKGHKPAGRKDFIVNSAIVGGSAPIKVDWRIRNNKVIDIIVEGVSMSVTQRSEFASIIQRNGGQVASLISHLEK